MCGLPPPRPPAAAAMSLISASARTPRSRRSSRDDDEQRVLAVLEAGAASTPTPLPSCSRSASPSACSSFTSPARTTPATSRAPFAPIGLRTAEQRLQLVAAAAHRFVEPASRARAAPRAAPATRFSTPSAGVLQQLGDAMQRLLLAAHELVRAGPGHRLDAAHAGRDAGLAHDLEEADLRRVAHVRAAAQLHREVRESSRRARRRRTSRRTAPSRPARALR